MSRPLIASISTTDNGRPPIVIENFPGLYAEFRPAQLRELARQLNDIANDACHGLEGKRAYPQEAA